MMKVRESKKKKGNPVPKGLLAQWWQPENHSKKAEIWSLDTVVSHSTFLSWHTSKFISFSFAMSSRKKKHDLEKAQNEKKNQYKSLFFFFNLIGILHIYRVISYTQSNPLNSSVIFLLKKV